MGTPEPKPSDIQLIPPPSIQVIIAILFLLSLAWNGVNTAMIVRQNTRLRDTLADESLSRKAGDEATLCITNAYVDGLYRKVHAIELQQQNATPEQFEQLKLWHKVSDAELQHRINQLLQRQNSQKLSTGNN